MNLDKVRVELQSKEPHSTLFLKVWADSNNEPTKMYEALGKIGWWAEPFPPATPLPAEHCYSGGYAKGDLTLIVERSFTKNGTALFCGWKPAEAKKNVPVLRNVLRKFGFIRVGHRKLTIGDCL